MNSIEKYNDVIMTSYNRFDLVLDKGEGETFTDENGKSYIDFGSGIGVNSLGLCNEEWADAVCKQVRTMQHCSNLYYSNVAEQFAEKLTKATGYVDIFCGNSGAEANECAIKLARKYSFDKYGKGRHNIITLVNSFHGRTMATLSATGQDVFHNYFFPFLEGFIFVEANNIDDLKAKLDDTVCAVMFEHIQGEGGVLPLEKSFVDAIYELTADKDILTIADEVQTGVGRTGKFLAAEYFGHKPDIVTLAKGIAGGVPMGVCMSGEKCAKTFTPGTHGSTFGANPLACAGGIAVLDKICEDAFLDEVVKKGEYIRKKLAEIDEVKSVSGLGLMLGVEFKTKKSADVVKACFEKGIIFLTAKAKLRMLPPLTITYEEIDKGMAVLAEVLS